VFYSFRFDCCVFLNRFFFFCLDGWQGANAARRLQSLARNGWHNVLVKVTNLTVQAVQTDQHGFVDMLEAALWYMTLYPGAFPQTANVRAHLFTVLTLANSARQRRSEDKQRRSADLLDQTVQSLVELRRVLTVLVQLVPPSDVAANPVLAAALESHLETHLAGASSMQTPSNTITAGGKNAEESN
jgi:hypothetical protein